MDNITRNIYILSWLIAPAFEFPLPPIQAVPSPIPWSSPDKAKTWLEQRYTSMTWVALFPDKEIGQGRYAGPGSEDSGGMNYFVIERCSLDLGT